MRYTIYNNSYYWAKVERGNCEYRLKDGPLYDVTIDPYYPVHHLTDGKVDLSDPYLTKKIDVLTQIMDTLIELNVNRQEVKKEEE